MRFDRRTLMLGVPPLDLWPTADPSHLPATDQAQVRRLCKAIWDFFGEPERTVATILTENGVHREVLYRAARRCLQKHQDGNIYGFRAALPYIHIKHYQRQAAVQPVPYERGGCAGAFDLLLRDYPEIEQVIRKALKRRSKPVKPGGQVRQPIFAIHQDFVAACRDAGITADRYPLNTRRLGMRALCSFIRLIVDKDFDMAVSHAGGRKSRAAPSSQEQAPAATRPYEVVEFDGHKMDLRLTVKLVDPYGFEQTLRLHRIWILVLLDVLTRSVIGYHIALGAEYNKDDVAAALQNALTPAVPRHYRIPNLKLRSGGGFPSGQVPETAFACWDWFRMDGAKSHLAGDTLARLNQIVGCWTDNGPPGSPNDRPYIERFFDLVASHFAHRLPGTVGSTPESIERALSDPGGDVRLEVELSELEDMIHVLISNYNATPHHGLGGKTPLEAMAYCVHADTGWLRTLPMPLRSNLCLMQEARIIPIKGSVEAGVRPHINFAYVRYTNQVLASNAGLIGRKLRIYYDVRDIRAIKAFFEDGTELGILTAARPWNITPHSLRVRQEIHRIIAERKLTLEADECPVRGWVRYKWKQIKGNKRAANALAKAQAEMPHLVPATTPLPLEDKGADATTSQVVSTENPTGDIVVQPPELVPGEPAASPKPKILQIRRTITF